VVKRLFLLILEALKTKKLSGVVPVPSAEAHLSSILDLLWSVDA